MSCPAAAAHERKGSASVLLQPTVPTIVQAGAGEAFRLAGEWLPLWAPFSVAAFSATISAMLPAQRPPPPPPTPAQGVHVGR